MNKVFRKLAIISKWVPTMFQPSANYSELDANNLKKKPFPDTTPEPSREWVNRHLDELHQAGFYPDDLFRENLPKGIVHMRIFEKPGLKIKIEPGLLIFSWRNINGKTGTQTCRPEGVLSFSANALRN